MVKDFREVAAEMDVNLHLRAHEQPHYCPQMSNLFFSPNNPCWMYKLLKRLDEAEFRLRNVGMDYGEACDHPADCNCSMAKAVQAWAKYDNLTMSDAVSILDDRR